MFERQFTVLNTELVTTVFFDGTDSRIPDEAAHEEARTAGEKLFG